MKRLILILFPALSFTCARSQVLISILFGDKLNGEKLEFGLMLSPTLCNLTNNASDYRTGFGLGLYFNYKFNDRFYFHPEAIPKAAMGAKGIAVYPTGDSSVDNLFKGGSVQRNIKTISLPLLFRYRMTGLLFLEAGPQIDWMLGTKDIFKTTVNDNPVEYTSKINSSVANFDVGWATGLVYKFSKEISMAAGIRYYYGFTDVMKPTPGSQHNSAWMLNVYIPIGANKAAKKREAATKQAS